MRRNLACFANCIAFIVTITMRTVCRVGCYSSLTCTPLLLLNKLNHTDFLQDRSYFMWLFSSYQNFIAVFKNNLNTGISGNNVASSLGTDAEAISEILR